MRVYKYYNEYLIEDKMKKKLFLIALLIVVVVALVCLCGCNRNTRVDMTGKTAVVYELEGGKYQNCYGHITHFYDVDEGESKIIYSPEKLSNVTPERAGYTFEGWYRDKVENDDLVAYSGEWDFENDKITNAGVTLYAYWAPKIKYTYQVCYYDEKTSEKKILGTYDTSVGGKYDDFAHYEEKRNGWTVIALKDADGNPWDPDFEHPGGETSTAIDVVVEYLKGTYKVCSTGKDLLDALKGDKNANIYLKNDIDCDGCELDFGTYGNYMGTFIGNGYTVSNFKVAYEDGKDGRDTDNLLNASIFGNAYKANISDVTFDNVTLNYKSTYSASQGIVIGVLGSRVERTTISNVKVTNMTIIISEIPSNLNQDDITIVTDALCAEVGAGCTFSGECTVENIILENKVEENK